MDWWDTTGAAVLLTGAVSTVTLVIGFVARPWVEGRVKETDRKQARRERSIEQGVDLAAELHQHLYGGFATGFLRQQGMGEASVRAWSGDLRRRTTLLTLFSPVPDLQQAAKGLAERFDALSGKAFGITGYTGNPAGLQRALDQYDEKWNEAKTALDEFIAALRQTY